MDTLIACYENQLFSLLVLLSYYSARFLSHSSGLQEDRNAISVGQLKANWSIESKKMVPPADVKTLAI